MRQILPVMDLDHFEDVTDDLSQIDGFGDNADAEFEAVAQRHGYPSYAVLQRALWDFEFPNPREAGDDDGVEYADPRDPSGDWRDEL